MVLGELDEVLEVVLLSSRNHKRPNILTMPKSEIGTCLTAGITKQAGTSARPIPAATRAIDLSNWSVQDTTRILMPCEASALVPSWNLSLPVRTMNGSL